MEKVRLQKFLSEQGVASRRKAEQFISGGHVTVNGKAAKLGDKVDPVKDKIKVFGKALKPTDDKLYIVLNKPKGYVCSKRDPLGRRTVFSLLPEELRKRVWNVGRLDFNTEGLLVMTNDGELTQQISHPSFEHEKEYEVEINLPPTERQLTMLRQGVEIASGITSPAKVKTKGKTLIITIHEGKKHQVKRMIEAVGLSLKSLKRTRVNKLSLPKIPVGKYVLVKREDLL